MSPSSPRVTSLMALFTLTLAVLAAATAISGCCGMPGCNLASTKYTYDHSYTVTVTGVSNYTGGDGFRMLLPVPMSNGAPAYTGDEIRAGMLIFPPPLSVFADYQTVHESRLVNNTGWTASLVDTEKGPMIELRATNAVLTDFMYILTVTKDVPASERDRYPDDTDFRAEGPLYPVSAGPSGQYTVPGSYSDFNYTSYVFFEGALTPRPGANAGNISVSVEYHELFAEGSVPAFRQSGLINESLPANVTGWIPVTVQKIL